MKIFLDVDGVLANFEQNVIGVANSLWPGKLPLDYVPQNWAYSDVFSTEDWSKVWEEIKTIPDFWLREPPISDNVSALRTWMHLCPDHEIFFITSRIDTGGIKAADQTREWLYNLGLRDSRTHVIAVKRAEEKKQIVADLKIDIGLDDYAPTVEALNTIPHHYCFLLDRPWNRESKQPRVHSVKDFLNMTHPAQSLR